MIPIEQTEEQRKAAFQAAGVPLPPTKDRVIVSTKSAESAIQGANDLRTQLTTPTAVGTAQTEQKPKPAPEKTGGGYSFDEAFEIFGKDFTGVQRLDDGTYDPDSSALSRIGIKTDKAQETGLQQEINTAKAEYETAVNDLKNLDISKDPTFLRIAEGITSTWDKRIREMEQANISRQASLEKTGIRLGSRFVSLGETMGGLISTEEKDGIQRVVDLESQKNSALANAEIAFRNEKWEEYVKFVDLAEEKYEQSVGELNALNEKAIAKSKEIADQRKAQLDFEKSELTRMKDTLDNISGSIYNSLTGDAEADSQTIQYFASLYNLDANYITSALLDKQTAEQKSQVDMEAVQALTEQRRAAAQRSLRGEPEDEPTVFYDSETNEKMTPYEAAYRIVEKNPNGGIDEIVNAIRQNVVDSKGRSLITAGDAQRIAKEGMAKRPALTTEGIKQKIVSSLTPIKDQFTRKEAKTQAENQLKVSLKLAKGQSLPKSYQDVIEDALVEVYGRTFFQKIFPGGR